MRNSVEEKMGKFKVEMELANNHDMELAAGGHLDPAKIRRVKIQGVVDSGATRLVLPLATVKQLGLAPTGKVKVRYADRRTGKRDNVEGVYLELLGRHGVFTVSVEPKRETALIGAFVLEDLDFLVDCTNQRLVPRDPKYVVNEIG
jgi:predicted aspartyl protease